MNSPKNLTCPSGKLRTEFTSPTAKSTSPGLSRHYFLCTLLTSTSNISPKHLTSMLYFFLFLPFEHALHRSTIVPIFVFLSHRLSWHHWHVLCNVYHSTFKWHIYMRGQFQTLCNILVFKFLSNAHKLEETV